MKNKKKNKKPPTGQGQGGKGENERGRDVFYPDNNTNPTNCQIDMPKVDFAKLADTLRMESEYFAKLAEAADLLSDAESTLNPVYAGGTVYQIHLQGEYHED